MIVVDGLNTIIDRKSLWSVLLGHVYHQRPLIVIGDYNAVCSSLDRANGTLVTDANIEDFEDFLLSSSLIEARSTRLFYSWSNSSVGDEKVVSRIDEAFVNHEWISKYAEVTIQDLPPGVSDHSPLMFTLHKDRHHGEGLLDS